MKTKNIYTAAIGFFIAALLFASCSDDKDDNHTAGMDAQLNLTVSTRSTSDELIKDEDGKFSSLALYVFNKADGNSEYKEMIPDITPEYVEDLSRSIPVSRQTKVIYAIGNYNDPDKVFSNELSEIKTLNDLEALIISNRNGFDNSSILMVGKQEVTTDGLQTEVSIPMERLVSRLDIYAYKSSGLANSTVTVKSIELVNQITNTYIKYQNRVMVSPVEKQNKLKEITGDTPLEVMPDYLVDIARNNPAASFYSYQNIAASDTPDDAITPYLRITAEIDGSSHTYKGYITDGSQTTDKYSLNRNTVYTIMAMIDLPENDLILKTFVSPWTVVSSQIGHVVKEGDYEFVANNEEAEKGVVQYPYIQDGETQDGSSYAGYTFLLKAPEGAVWTATLTNGLEFVFGTDASADGQRAVSKGIAGKHTNEIKVGATKPWDGAERVTHLYITVDGQKLNINPVQSNGLRKFPGDNDTDILITQTESI